MREETISVLLIEDNPADARLIRELLAESPVGRFGIEHVDRLYKGIQALRENGADVVVLDLSLPDSRGLQTFTELHEACHGVPIVVLTGFSDADQALQAVREGADDYLNKSALNGGEELARALRYAVQRHHARQERRRLEAQMRHTQKLESLGVLAGGIAHDFNNLLMGILGHASLALMDLPAESPARYSVEQIETAAVRAAELTKQLLAYSGKGRFSMQPLNLSRAVEEIVHLLQTVISKKVELRLEFPAELPDIMADPSQIQQILMNLLTNASEAIQDGAGTITISTGTVHVDEDFLADTYTVKDVAQGTYVYVEVCDTGQGMDEETMERIFDPFFTTKMTGRGLGLAAVLGIVQAHLGAIKVTSEPEAGTTVRVLFPPAGEPRPRTPEPAPPTRDWEGSGTVLVVDDEDSVRTVATGMLERMGFDVVTARDGAEAVEVFSYAPERYACVLLDVSMPVMSGTEAFHELRNIREDVCVLLSSGYDESEAARRLAEEDQCGFIQKPYRPDSLAVQMRSICGRDAEPAD